MASNAWQQFGIAAGGGIAAGLTTKATVEVVKYCKKSPALPTMQSMSHQERHGVPAPQDQSNTPMHNRPAAPSDSSSSSSASPVPPPPPKKGLVVRGPATPQSNPAATVVQVSAPRQHTASPQPAQDHTSANATTSGSDAQAATPSGQRTGPTAARTSRTGAQRASTR